MSCAESVEHAAEAIERRLGAVLIHLLHVGGASTSEANHNRSAAAALPPYLLDHTTMTASKPSKGNVYLLGSGQGRVTSDIYRRVAAALPAHPRVAYSLAALESTRYEASTRDHLAKAFPGATIERLAVTGEHGATTNAAARVVIAQADVLYFGGGDPVLVARRLVDAGADDWIRAARERGAVCIGLSAGSIALGAYWASWSDEEPDAPPELVPCVGAASKLVVDCHAEADKWEELRTVHGMLSERAADFTFVGIGHGGAVVVDGEDRLEWIGPEVVIGG